MWKRFSVIVFILWLLVPEIYGQNNNSPYSIFGLGEIYQPGYLQYPEYGGAAIGFMHSSKINFSNPASYRSIDSLRFVLEIGMTNNNKIAQNEDESAVSHNFNISHYAFGFPVCKWWHTSIGLIPMSNRGYRVVDYGTNIQDGETYETYYIGSGNLNQVYFGNSISLMPNLSIGANISYMFGELLETRTILFPNSLFTSNSQAGYTKQVNGYRIETGLMYTHKLGELKRLNIGLTYNPEQSITYTEDYLAGSTLYSNLDNISDNVILDTTTFYEDSSRAFTLPHQIGFGFSIEDPGKRTFTASAEYSLWGSLDKEALGSSITEYKDNLRISAGYSFIPKWNHPSSYFKRMTYRFGAFFDNSYIEVNEQPINEFAFTAGIGLPVRRVGAMFNAGIEIGQKGLIKDQLIRESYFKLNLKINFTEIWFLEQKYD